MASIFDRYGLKEVSNVSIYSLDAQGNPDMLVLYLDSLKVSTIEQTAESTDATGGWGNPKLISWDYGKEITLTLEDALLSPESMRIMMGGAIRKAASEEIVKVHVTSKLMKGSELEAGMEVEDMYGNTHTLPAVFRGINMTTGAQFDEGCFTAAGKPGDSDEIRLFFVVDMKGAEGTDAYEITISPSTFPGTYYFVGDTLLRSETSGEDEPYQWVLPKGKISSEITFTMEADGDPATFEFTVNALRAKNADGDYEMMKFVKYNFASTKEETAGHTKHNKELLTGASRENVNG